MTAPITSPHDWEALTGAMVALRDTVDGFVDGFTEVRDEAEEAAANNADRTESDMDLDGILDDDLVDEHLRTLEEQEYDEDRRQDELDDADDHRPEEPDGDAAYDDAGPAA